MSISSKIVCCLIMIIQLMLCNVIAQNNNYTLKGRVLDEDSKSVSSLTVSLVELDKRAITNANGFFEFTKLPYGTYTLVITNENYQSLTIQIHFTDEEASETIMLKPIETLGEVTLKGKKRHALKTLGYELNVIPLKNEVGNTKTLNQVLQQKSSINVRQSGGLGSRTNYSLNGLSDNSIRFFIDGIPMEYYGASFSINTIPVSVIDKIEIYKGVTPIYLSNDNLGGAINLITKKGVRNTAEVTYSYGSFNTHISSVYANVFNPKRKSYINALGFYNYSDNNYKIWGDKVLVTNPKTFEVTRNNEVERFHDAFTSKGIKVTAGVKQKTWTDTFEGGLIYADLDKDIQHGTTMEVPFGEAKYYQKNYTAFLNYQTPKLLRKKLGIQLYSGYSNLTRTHVDTTKNTYNWDGTVLLKKTAVGGEQFNKNVLSTLKKQTLLQKLLANYKLNTKHDVYFTSQLASVNRNDDDPTIANKNEAYFTPQHFNKNTFGLALASKWMNSRLKTSVFLKHHSFNASIKTTQDGQTFTNTNANESLVGYGMSSAYKINQHLSLSASFEKSNRLPEEQEVLGNGVSIISTDKLNAEQSYNYNLGIQQQLALSKSSILTYNLSLFRRAVKDLIKLWQKDDSAFIYINFDEVNITGADLELDYKWNNILRVNYAVSRLFPLLKSKFDENGNKNLLFNTELPNTLLFKSTLNTQLNFNSILNQKDAFTVKWASNFTDSFFVLDAKFGESNKDKIPRQLSHNIGLNYKFSSKKISIGFDCTNIFNAQLFDNFAIQKPGRAFYTKINWSII